MNILQTTYYVYIVTDETKSRLKTDMTGDLEQRLAEPYD